MTVLNAWPKWFVYGAIDYVDDYIIYPTFYGIIGDFGRYLGKGLEFQMKMSVPANFNFNALGLIKNTK